MVGLQILELHERPPVCLLMAPSTLLQARRAGQSPSALGILGQFKRDRCHAPDCGPPSHAGQPVDLVQLVSDSKCGPQSVLGRHLAGATVGSCQKSVLMPLSMWTVLSEGAVKPVLQNRQKACTCGTHPAGRWGIALPANPSNIER